MIVKNWITNNKWCILFLTGLFFALFYCATQTFIINDDLPYSMYYRGSERITNIKEIIFNQIQDYQNISPRIFVHSVVQFLLIFNKDLWSILNPMMIILTIILLAYIVKTLIKNKDIKFIWLLIAFTFLYLLLYNHKYIIYWVAGSVNYVWTFVLLLLFIIFALKGGLKKHFIWSAIIIAFLSALHECLAVFLIIYVLSYMILEYLKDKNEFKTFFWKYFTYLIAAILGFSFLLLAPSTTARISTGEFAELSLIGKLLVSIPTISTNVFAVKNIYNLFPVLFIISIGYYIFKKYNKYFFSYFISACLLMIVGISFNNGWFWFILGVFLLIIQSIMLFKDKKYCLIAILISGYAVSYSLAITPEYLYGRTNYYLFLILSLLTVYNIFTNADGKFEKNLIKILFGLGCLITICFEIYIYNYIGEIKNSREQSILAAKRGESKIIEIKKMKYPFNKFHIDSNGLVSKDYWAYKHFKNYYNLPDDVDIKFVK